MFVSMLFLGVSLASAEENNRLYWGPKAGLNISTITKSEASAWRAGANVGMFAMCRYNDYWGLEADLMFSMMGTDYDEGNIRLNYLTLPILGKLYLFRNLNMQLGPQFGVKVYDKINMYDVADVKNSGAFTGFEVMFVVGLGYEFNFGMTADVRYGIGLTNSIKDSYALGDKCKNEMFQISVGWRF